jgi:succinate dehydrogenase/fumarate reductase flavoprotein subunit
MLIRDKNMPSSFMCAGDKMEPENKTEKSIFHDIAKLAGATMAVPLVMAMNANATENNAIKQEVIETDLLIVGGGIAGIFAALKAKEQGINIVVVDKGTVGRSGLSPWFGAYNYYDPVKSAPKDTWRKEKASGGKYLGNPAYVEHFLDDSEARYKDMVAMGADKPGIGHVAVFRDILLGKKIKLIERVMVTELIKSGERVCGAVGFSLDEEKAVVIKAKAVLLCSGSGALKPSGFPVAPLTHDGDAMSYRAGAEISGKEFIDFHWTHIPYPAASYQNWEDDFGNQLNVNTNAVFNGPAPLGQAMSVHEGQIPLTMGPRSGGGGTRPSGPPAGGGGPLPGHNPPGIRDMKLPIVGGSTAGMAPHKCEGIFPKNDRYQSNLEGLFAAGDALCTAGATYHGFGSSSSMSAVQGGRSALYAAEYAKKAAKANVADAQIAKIVNSIFAPRTAEHGYNPEWVTLVLQSMMTPYYVLYIKSKDRLEAALTNIKFLRDQFASNLIATNAHELRQAHEVKNMILNSEMKLRASLLRTESRGAHYREDFPEQDDKNWLAWVIISQKDGAMNLEKKEVPETWKPKA